ncbi:MAG: ABC transporter ATP-binding protein [Deltaproteobacteria bacterium]|jgi:branched-chain amino acid transport system ATP-binding protein|nr:ABC transporter ATP-binding protein [Deltaproteobacteria bacterium]
MSEVLLKATNMTMQFGGLRAVDSFNLTLRSGELVGLIGPNGAGKTTCFNCLTSVYTPTSGSVEIRGIDTKGMKPWQISKLGMTRTFQNIRLFKDLTVLDNVIVAGLQHTRHTLFDSILRSPRHYIEEARLKERALELLAIFNLQDKAELVSGSLPYGEQRRLEIVRALATEPRTILLDEPAAGMNNKETEDLMNTIAKIRKDFRLTVLLIEHDMKLVMGICERILVLDHGTLIAEGSPAEIKSDPKVIAAYLGTEETV